MNERRGTTRYSGIERRRAAERNAAKAAAPQPPPGEKTGRHSAITNNLQSWRSYKNWLEKVRGFWDDKK